MKLKLALALLILAVPAQAAPHLIGSVRGAGAREKSFLWLGGGYFPGKGWRTDAQSKGALQPGTRWQVFGLAGPGPSFTTGALLPPDVPLGYNALAREALPARDSDQIAIANAAPHAQPRLPRAQNLKQPLYQRAAAELLRRRGLQLASANLTQLLRVDLNGDGAEEVLLSARSRADYGSTSEVRAGDYALLALRFVDRGQVKTLPLELEFSTKNVGFSAPGRFEVAACADVDGEGKMEILVSTGYYEGWGFEVWQFDGHGLKRVLEAGWGV